MELFKNLPNLVSEQTETYNFPQAVYDDLKDNPYIGKYSNMEVENTVYMLYCDFSSALRWIKDSKKPDTFYSNYIKSIQILKELNKYSKIYQFHSSTPIEQLNDLQDNFTKYSNKFISQYWKSTKDGADKLKTEKAKQNRYDTFFSTMLNDYSNYLTNENISYIQSLKREPNKSIPSDIKNIEQVSCGKYDVSSIEKIRSIPINDTSAMRLLQKSATDHKRNNNIELAIECLRKSNQISDFSNDAHNKLSDKEYTRILKYMETAGFVSESEQEKQRIKFIHPEFYDKRISNLIRIKEYLNKANEYGIDVVYITTNSHCQFCKQYNKKKFSISGQNNKYLKLPDTLKNEGGFCNECIVGITLDFGDI